MPGLRSGQVPVDADGNLVGKDDPAAQVRQVFANLAGVLAAAGATMAQVVKFTYFVTDMSLLSAVRQVRDEFIDASRPPASSFVQVAGLVNPDFMIEIEALVATVTRRGGGRFRRRPTGRSGRASAR